MKTNAAVAGLGATALGKVYGRTAADLAAEAINLALADAGLVKSDIDGLLINANLSPEMRPRLQMSLGLEDLTILNAMSASGSTAGTMLQYASFAISSGVANVIALVYSDTPLTQGKSISEGGYGGGSSSTPTGLDGLKLAYGDLAPAAVGYALAASRHMSMFGTTSEQLGAIAVAERKWATMNPWAQMRTEITLDDHQASRMVVAPLHLLDCCLVSNGAIAVIVTSPERARSLRQPPVYIRGTGQCAPGDNLQAGRDPAIYTGARKSGELALRAADITLADVDVLELYDCFTYAVLVTIEDYGFCEKGEGGDFVSDGRLAPGGSLPTNTGGGQLSSYYLWGFTPLSEAIIQARGQGGERQVTKNDIILVSGNGGVLNYHSTAILSKYQN